MSDPAVSKPEENKEEAPKEEAPKEEAPKEEPAKEEAAPQAPKEEPAKEEAAPQAQEDDLGEDDLKKLDVNKEPEPEAPAEAVPDILKETNSSGLDPKDHLGEVLIQQNDPNSPLYSVKSFEELGLSQELLQGIYGMNFVKPSKIQENVLPIVLEKTKLRNVIAQAHNGSGKTACFTLAMLARVRLDVKAPQALCLVPTRELARQTFEILEKMGKFTGITIGAVLPADKKGRPKPVSEQVLVGTPGKVIEMIQKNLLKTKEIQCLVLDEADEMCHQGGFADQTVRIKKKLPPTGQVLSFSATFPTEVFSFVKKITPNADIISVKKEDLTLDGIKQYFVDCADANEKFEILSEIYALLTIGQSIIFVNTREAATNLTNRLTADGHKVSLLIGGQAADKATRDKVMDEFRAGTTKVLITTNVLSRGIDVAQVSLVINYDAPVMGRDKKADPETYLHRIGRTGRFGRKGVAITFVDDQASKTVLRDIQNYYQSNIVMIARDSIESLDDEIRAH